MRRGPVFLLVLCAVFFAAGLLRLFQLRFAVGDVYPAYSSLRSDPLGTMALCESLGRLPGCSVRRDFSASNQLPDGKGTTYLHLGGDVADWRWLPDDLANEIQSFLARGGRLAITFFPLTSRPPHFQEDRPEDVVEKLQKQKPKAGSRAAKRKKEPKSSLDELLRRASLKERWGVGFGYIPLKASESETNRPASAVNQSPLSLPECLDWHSGMVFTNLDPTWQTIYARAGRPVVVERKFGPGTIVLAADSYFLSNEALRKDRHADLLAWLVGPGGKVVFDEAHFGLVEDSGVAALFRKYRLHGLVAGLILLAGLFIWKNSLSLAPPAADQGRQEYVAGKETAAGFVNLLRRNVLPRDVLPVCLGEWKKSFANGSPRVAAKLEQVQALLEAENARPQRERNAVRTYREICQVLKHHRS